MDIDGAWDTDVEILSLAHLLHTNIYTFDTTFACWLLFAPKHQSTLQFNFCTKAMYIVHYPSHYDVFSTVIKPIRPCIATQ